MCSSDLNKAGDDAAGMAVSERLKNQVRGLNQAARNAQDGISLIQTAEGAMGEAHTILARMRELAIQASNDTVTASDRTNLMTEFSSLYSEIDRIADGIRTDAWYELRRVGLTMPFPQRVVQYVRPKDDSEAQARHIAEILGRNMIFGVLSETQRQKLVIGAHKQLFGKAERIFRQGEEGNSLYVIVEGEADVFIDLDGRPTRVNVVRSGECLGEFSLLTGEKLSASVQATKDCEVVLIPRERMAEVLRESPELVERLSEILALRRLETEVILAETQTQRNKEVVPKSQEEYASDFMRKMQDFFSV